MKKFLHITFINILFFSSICYATQIKAETNLGSRLIEIVNLASEEVITFPGKPFICPGGNKVLTASNAPAGSIFQWYKNNAAIVNARNESYTVTDDGEYSVIITNAGISKTYPKVRIETVPLPEAKFSQVPSGNCSANRQFFTNESIGQNLTYEWNFGDPNSGTNNISADANGRHFFIGSTGNGSQTFTVTLTATNEAGCSHSVQRDVTFKQSPNVNLTANNAFPEAYSGAFYFKDCSNTPITFTFKNISNTTNVLYDIDWGDNDPVQPRYQSANFTSVSHTYKPGKIYRLSYTVTGANGCFNNRVFQIMVGARPTIAFGNFNNFINTGDEVTIPVIGASNNTAGTFYRVDYSDGIVERTVLSLNNVKHTFPKSSFGESTTINNIVYPNAYSAFIRAYNVCGEPPRSFSTPIYISDKQPAVFTSGSQSICQNETKVFSYNEQIGHSVTRQGVGYENRLLWKISPNSGYTVVDGSLGLNNSQTDPYLWSAGSRNLSIKFTNDGTYNSTLITGTANGVEASITKQIEVKALPTVNKPVNQNICNGKVCIKISLSGNLPNTVYNWRNSDINIGLAEFGNGDIPEFTALNNTGAAIVATITVTPTLNNCTGEPQIFTITVDPAVTKPITVASLTYCLNNSAMALSAVEMPGNSLKWFTNQSLINGSSTAPIPTTNSVGTTSYYVTQVNAGGCESEPSKIDVIVNPLIVNNITTGNQALCYDAVAEPLTQASGSVTGGDNSFNFQWQSSIDGINWTIIVGATQRTYAPGRLTLSKKYRRKISSGSCEDFSNVVTIQVQNSITNYEIANDVQVVEPRQTPKNIIGEQARGGSGMISYYWESSTDNNTWRIITGANAQNHQPQALLQTTHFRRTAKSGICLVTSLVVTITIYNGIKNTFTPNDDGINDTWDLSGFTVNPGTQVKVYNRLGQVVFQGQNQSTWNGEFQGNKLPMGVYYYTLLQHNEKPVKGWISIIY